MKLRTVRKQIWIKKVNGEETAEFLCDLLTPKESLQIIDEVRTRTRNKDNPLDGDSLYKAKIIRIDKTIIDWKGLEDEEGNPIPCNSKNKELVYNFNRDLIDEVLDDAEKAADVRNEEKGEAEKN